MPLSTRDRALLDIESKSWRFPGAKESAIREATGLSWHQAAQVLHHLIDTPDAMSYAPITCRLLRARRDRLKRSRSVVA